MPHRLLILSVLLGIASACKAPAERHQVEVAMYGGSASYEQVRDALPRTSTGAWLVEGDIPIYDEAELRRYVAAQGSPGALTIKTVKEGFDQWRGEDPFLLSYCVSDEFGAKKQQVVNDMAKAAGAWEQLANVVLYHRPASDASCDERDHRIMFRVRPGSCGSCNAWAFFPSYPEKDRELRIADRAFSGAKPLVSTLMHELGHVLGFRHEHIWSACTSEDTDDAVQLTNHDTASIMQYIWCDDATHDGVYELTELDALGAACIYNQTMPLSACHPKRDGDDLVWWARGSGERLNPFDGTRNFVVDGVTRGDMPDLFQPVPGDFNGDGLDDILWQGFGMRPDGIWLSEKDGSFSSRTLSQDWQATPLVGDFDGDRDDDIYWYGSQYRPDFFWTSNGDGSFDEGGANEIGVFRPFVGDFDGNQVDDIFWFAPNSTDLYIAFYQKDGSVVRVPAQGIEGDFQPAVGDFDNDGMDDIFWYAKGAARDYVWWGTGNRIFTPQAATADGDFTVFAGDFDGDGLDDVFFYGTGDAADEIWWSGAGRTFGAETISIDVIAAPVPGNFDGNQATDIFWYAPFGKAGDGWSGDRKDGDKGGKGDKVDTTGGKTSIRQALNLRVLGKKE